MIADGHVVGGEPELGVGIADAREDLARDRLTVDAGGRRDLAREDDVGGRDERLAGDAGVRVLSQAGVEHRV